VYPLKPADKFLHGLFTIRKLFILPSNQTPYGTLPARFKKQRILIIGCGDVGTRLAKLAPSHVRLIALTSNPDKALKLTRHGITPIVGNLDEPITLGRLAGLGQRVVHLAPPTQKGSLDLRTMHLTRALIKSHAWQQVVYASTSGVYGDCNGDWVDETRALNPLTERALRRVHAEGLLRWMGRLRLQNGFFQANQQAPRITILRVPGIYAPDRDNGTPLERLKKGTGVLQDQSDVYTNHIHANDLARACWLALWRGANQRAINVSDDSYMKMGEYMDWAADHYGLKRPERLSMSQAMQTFSAVQLSFMQESRRLVNTRMKKELRLKLQYPSVKQGLDDPGSDL
jgi:nucleoside-diphosphate-sugar epimerase